ncbi:MAG: class I SAM-dependent methyltransferase family protein [archaeon]
MASQLAVKVAKKKAEPLRRKLVAEGIFDRSRQIAREGEFVILPVLKKPKGLKTFRTENLQIQTSQNQSLERRLSSILPPGSLFSKSFDIVGTVGILDVGKLSSANQEFAAEALRQVYPSLTAVCTRAGTIEDEFRIRPLKLLWGKTTETIHNENGIRLKLDPAKVYFSPRQAAERVRVSSQICPGEQILVMFAGCGPYSTLIAKNHPDCRVFSVELNPAGVKYLEENISLNKVGKNSRAFLGDVRKVVPKLGRNSFDRIIMPLPKDAENFLELAASAARPGAIINFYSFGRDFSEGEKTISERLGAGAAILNRQKCGDIAPGKFRLVFDIRLSSGKPLREPLRESLREPLRESGRTCSHE